MCKQPSNSNNVEKYEKAFEWVQYWKRGINLLWREHGNGLEVCSCLLCSCRKSSLLFSPSFIVSVLYNLCALPDFKHWMVKNLASLCLEGDIGRGFFLIHCIFFFFFCPCWKHNNYVYFAPLAAQPSEMQPAPRAVLKPPQNPPLPQHQKSWS